MTIKEYAISRAVSYEAAAKQVRQYKKKELKKHIKYNGRTAELDDFAVEFLDKHRQPKNIVVTNTEESQRIIDQQAAQIKQLQAELLKRTDKINELLEEKTLLIEDKAKKELLEKDNQELKQELSSYKPTLFGLYKKVARQQATE